MASVRVRTVGPKQNKNQNILIALFFEMRVKSQKTKKILPRRSVSCVLANNVLRRLSMVLVITIS